MLDGLATLITVSLRYFLKSQAQLHACNWSNCNDASQFILSYVTEPAKTGQLGTWFLPTLIITFYPNMLWQWNFRYLIQIYLVLWCRLWYENILFQYWDMTFRETGCSLCPHSLFLQAQSHILLLIRQICKYIIHLYV